MAELTTQNSFVIDNRRAAQGSTVIEDGARLTGNVKRTSLSIGLFELAIQYPAELELPNDIERLLKGVAKKVEDWAQCRA